MTLCYCSPNIVRWIKCGTVRSAGHVARMEESSTTFRILTGKPTGKRPLGGLREDGKNILELDGMAEVAGLEMPGPTSYPDTNY